MIKLTRLNQHTVAINPDHIAWIEALPDTTLFLIGNEKILVREAVDDVIDLVIEFRRLVRRGVQTADDVTGDPPHVGPVAPRRASDVPTHRASAPAPSRGGH